MRTRTRVNLEHTFNCSLKVVRENGTATEDRSTICTLMSQQSMTDQKSPGYYKAKRENAVLPVGPMSKTNVVWSGEPGLFKGVSRAVPGGGASWDFMLTHDVSGIFGPGNLLRDAFYYSVDQPAPAPKEALLQNALARAQTDAWDVATFLAELGKTVEMFRSAADRYKDHALRVRLEAERRHSTLAGRAQSLADVFADVWLEFRYGVRPIIYDLLEIQRVIEKLSKGIETPLARGWATWEGSQQHHRSTVFQQSLSILGDPPGGTQRFDAPGSFGGWWFYASGDVWTGITTERKLERTARATVGVRVLTRNLTMVDLPVTTWEMVPFSFICDWFLTIGDCIAAFSPAATGMFEYATFSESFVETVSMKASPVMGASSFRFFNETLTAHGSAIRCTSESYARSIPAQVNPTLSVLVNVDAAKIVDLTAILYGFYSGFTRTLALGKRLPREFSYRPAKSKTLKTIRFSRS